METKYQTLRRPKRKLCYLNNKKSPSKQWAGNVSLGDVDAMFDGLDSPLDDDDIIPPSPLQTVNTEANLSGEHLTGPSEDVLHSASRSLSPELNIVEDLSIPFVLRPIKTSSPIKEKAVVEAVEEEDNERALVVPQILNFEEAKPALLNSHNPQCNDNITEESHNSELESPPSKVIFTKSTMSTQKKQVVTPCKESHQFKEKIPKKSQTLVLDDERRTPRKKMTEPLVSAVRQDHKHPSPPSINPSVDRQQKSTEISTREGKDIKSFLQKVRDAERNRPPCSRGLQSQIKTAVPPPEPEDEFLILDDDTPLIYIPSKNSTRKRQNQNQKETKAEQSRTDKGSPTDNSTKEPVEAAEKHEELQKSNHEQESQTVNQKTKKKDKKKEVTGQRNDEDGFLSSEEPLGCLVEQEKPHKKKQQLKKVQSEEDDTADKEPKRSDSKEKDEEKTGSRTLNKKTLKSSDLKSSKSSKNRKGNTKRQYTEAGDLGSLSDKQISSSEEQNAKTLADGNVKQDKLHSVSTGSSSEESNFLGRRKRKQPGHWWLSCPQITEETKVTDKQHTPKKSKQNNKDPRAGVLSPVKAKKDRVLKRRHQKQPVTASSENTNTEKKTKRKNKSAREETPDGRKPTDEVFKTMEIEQIEDHDKQHNVPVEDPDLQLSPLVLAKRDLSVGSDNRVFQRVYHQASNGKMSSTPTRVSTKRNREQLREAEADKRMRRPPGSWWLVDGVSEQVEGSSSQPQQLHHKKPEPRKGSKKKQSRSPRLGTPKNGNVAVSSKPLGGTSTPTLKVKQVSAPKTVKRSLATFKDIFTSATETETVKSNKDSSQNNKQNVTAPSAEASVFLQNTPPDSKCQSENTLKELRSGPSSMIELEQYEENEDMPLPSSRDQAVLSVSELCGPPLKPLILQPKDKANLTEWFKSLWPTAASNAAEITPDQFDWYFYQNRAIGFLLDVNCGSACMGRIVLGSYMKKPLWVDHSASTVFNLLTSSVNVVIDNSESRFHAGQCFTVQCGHAYSVQNATAQPAVLYFTRVLAEGSD